MFYKLIKPLVCVVVVSTIFASGTSMSTKATTGNLQYPGDQLYKKLKMVNNNSSDEELTLLMDREEALVKNNGGVEAVIVEDDEIRVTFMGDVCLGTSYGREYYDFPKYYSSYGAAYFFEKLRDSYGDSDYVFANLENGFTDNTSTQAGKIYTYKALPKYLDIIAASGITHTAAVNNHMHDYLESGFVEYNESLKAIGIEWFGSHDGTFGTTKLGWIDVDKKIILEEGDLKVGVLSYYGFNGVCRKDQDIAADIDYFKENDVNYIIAYVHWGMQHTTTVSNSQYAFGHKLVDKGVNLNQKIIATDETDIDGVNAILFPN